MRKKAEETIETPVSSLIDIVFLLIIFFVVTASVEKEIVDESITLAQAKEVKVADKVPKGAIIINVTKTGDVNIANQPLSMIQLQNILTASRASYGNHMPILIRADRETLYSEIDKVIAVVGRSGLYKIKLAAIVP